MPSVLIDTDIVKCLHAPGTAAHVPAPKLMVQGVPVLTALGPVRACGNVPPPAAKAPCTTVTITGGRSTKLKVSGNPVLLGSLVAKADAPPASPGGALTVTASQTKLNAI